MKKFHFLGHSLGAHVAGFAGKEVFRRLGKKIGRITALDAAGPLFEMPVPVDEDTRLSKRDAEFVDCIHTDGGIFGMTKAIGHIDFYPNGGIPRQPGCSTINIADLGTRVILEDSKYYLQIKDALCILFYEKGEVIYSRFVGSIPTIQNLKFFNNCEIEKIKILIFYFFLVLVSFCMFWGAWHECLNLNSNFYSSVL